MGKKSNINISKKKKKPVGIFLNYSIKKENTNVTGTFALDLEELIIDDICGWRYPIKI